jgi:hypothetical protein
MKKTPALSFRNAHHTVTVQAGVIFRPKYMLIEQGVNPKVTVPDPRLIFPFPPKK